MSSSTVINVIASSGLASSFRLTAEATAGTGNRARNDLVASGEQLGHNLVITMPNSLSDMKLDMPIFDTSAFSTSSVELAMHPCPCVYSLFSLICERACGVCPLQRRECVLLRLEGLHRRTVYLYCKQPHTLRDAWCWARVCSSHFVNNT